MKPADLNSALRYLKKDKHLSPLVKKYPKPDYKHGRNSYESLLRAIIYQQLSGKSASTILRRFLDLYPGAGYPKPEDVLKTSISKMRSAGVSGQKSGYIKDLSKKFVDGTIQPRKFRSMTNEEIHEHVIAVKGIGPWTADMFLMFTLNRMDVLPTGDLGIQKGFQKLFKLKKLPSPEKMEVLSESWRPYRTVACSYLWNLADEGNNNR